MSIQPSHSVSVSNYRKYFTIFAPKHLTNIQNLTMTQIKLHGTWSELPAALGHE